MSKSIFIIDTPTDCKHCKMRRVIHKADKHYQLCGLDCEHGYERESFFKESDLVDGWISDKCPLQSLSVIKHSSKELSEMYNTGFISGTRS